MSTEMEISTEAGSEIEQKIAFWKKKLSNITEIQLPLDYPRPLPPRYVDATVNQALPASAGLAVLQLSLNNRVGVGLEEAAPASPFTVLLSAFAILLHRYTGEEDITVGSSSLSSNPLVLRLPIRGTMKFSEVLRMVHTVEREANANDIPFYQLLEALYPSGANRNASPPFRVRFFNRTDTSEDTLNQTIHDLTVLIHSKASGSLRSLLPPIEVTVSYNQVLFSSARICHMLEQLGMVLEKALLSPEVAIRHFSLVSTRCLKVLPDPTASLGWEDWKGAIPDVFTLNSLRHPERPCLVETLAGRTRVFNYRQINRAANVVAHYLMQKGVGREDVVTVYAYRGAELVVGVMGILKAGCTFNVIDPAYPAARQQIYLSVARPRAILVLKQAGQLLPSVREYVDSGLHLQCELSGVQLQDDGRLLYTEDNLERAFDTTPQDKDANVELGPDSIATLSFTSGSTGIPKGVRGRHFSLTHFYPWMAQEFGLGEHDRFTMLSGIAHDPIQRDIFTPLFLGAELHIPDPEIIGIPGRLAEWMCDRQVTVTHLTPAMGQLLSANAVAFIPSLRNAFFVGDILTKRDCLRLQHLANNTSIINMYGTTETQRAVSYYRVPALSQQPSFLTSAKDVLPAGKGMRNVQLLVVSRADARGSVGGALCGVGEVGEIYVRSGGLSEGYLGLDDATREKFLTNWFAPAPTPTCTLPFFHGPRDRMYRSGDLGRYLPDGTVECIGRADDQVKIRGFRIELSEIDTHLSQHPRVRENVTLVRRDQNEEQTLVAYFVPIDLPDDATSSEDLGGISSLKAPRKYRKLIRDIREWLKLKLPSYSVPSVFVPLIKMPLNPNGKVDKPALPFPDTACQVAPAPAALATLSPTETMIYTIFTSVLKPTHQFSLDASFFDIGGHSILATRLIFQVRKEACVDVPLGLVFQHPTVRGMARAVDEVRSLDLNIAGLEASHVAAKPQPLDYSADLDALLKASPWCGLDKAKVTPRALNEERPTFFLTGATGFLGAFILSHLLARHPHARVFCLARATTDEHAFQRVQENCRHQLVWEDSWAGRVLGIKGDLASGRLGIDAGAWEMLVEQVDAIVHNGAQVHWVYPYAKLRKANVLGTLEVLKLALAQPNAAKAVHFVSSTSVLDTQHYVNMSERLLDEGFPGVPEGDDLEGSRTGLSSGYGQSKWVSEKLIMAAGANGLRTSIIRPGYIVGHSQTGVSVADDFLWRLVKGCIQLAKVPRMDNVVNMCPVDYVAEATAVAASLPQPTAVYHITNPHRFRFTQFFQALIEFGYGVSLVDYVEWRSVLMDVTLASEDNALYPLLHFVLDDLPTSTKAPELDATNTLNLLAPLEVTCPPMGGLMGRYLAYLIHVNFLPPPPNRNLPTLDLPPAGSTARSNRV